MPDLSNSTVVPYLPPRILLTDKYDKQARRHLIQQPIRDQLLQRKDELVCRIDIRLDINHLFQLKNLPTLNHDENSSSVIGTRMPKIHRRPPTSMHIAAYRDLHSLLFKSLDEAIFRLPANEIPRHKRTSAFSFAEDQSAKTKTPVPLHYHCLLFSSEPAAHLFLLNDFHRLKFFSCIESRFARRLFGTQFKCTFHRTFRIRMATSSTEDREQSINYATKFLDDEFLARRHRTEYLEQLQNYADESRLNQIILSTDFHPRKDIHTVKRRRNQKRRRSRATTHRDAKRIR